jgi:hypothetical protein
LAGCQFLGPKAIDQGRDRYNGVIQNTSMEQMMSNIVRVYNHEPTLFMDVTEVDAAQSFQGSLTGGATSIGAEMGQRVSGASATTYTGRLGNAAGTAQYTESPTIRYQPLLGQALVAQLVTPVNVNSLAQLYDSNWSIVPVLDFATDYMTLDADEFYSALNTIDELDDMSALELVAAKSDTSAGKSEAASKPVTVPKTSGGTVIIQTGGSGGGSSGPAQNDALVIYLLPYHPHEIDQNQTGKRLNNARRYLQLWARLLRIYQGTQSEPETNKGCKTVDLAALDKNVDTVIKTTGDFKKTLACLRLWIELRISPVPYQNADAGAKIENHAPMLRTRSAIGILKTATELPRPLIEFMTPAAYRAVVAHPWNQDVDGASFYTLQPGDEDSFNCPPERKAPADAKKPAGCDNPVSDKTRKAKIGEWIGKTQGDRAPFAYEAADPSPPADPALAAMVNPGQVDFLDDEHVRMNAWLGKMRRYVLIVVDDHLPSVTPYVAYSDGDHWYYIDAGDKISQKNFQLLSLFMTMMAIPSTSPPLTPTISVGGS